jgi:branched-subunit amino acid transport protein
LTPLRTLAGALAAVVAWRTESVLWTILSGLVAFVVLEALVGAAF